MKLQVITADQQQHTDVISAVCWSPTGELFTCSDDKSICRWSMSGEFLGKLCEFDAFITDIHWFPVVGKQMADIFAISCTDGTFRIMSKTGREEKRVQAHHGAITALRWSHDGSDLVTAGEDSNIKLWSRSGMLRSTLARTGNSIYSVCWSPDNSQIVVASSKDLIIRSLDVQRTQTQWEAHDGIVTKVDWNPVNGMIISGGEDCKYKVWDSFGRLLYNSQPLQHVITAVSWCPNGEYFVVGSFNSLKLCDKIGWSYCQERTNTGSYFSIDWTSDGTQFAGAGGSGEISFATMIERSLEWKNLEIVLVANNLMRVYDNLQDHAEELDFRDRVVEMALSYDKLVVATSTQCYIYDTGNWNTPHIFDLRDIVHLIVQGERYFAMVDKNNGVQIYSYEGRHISNPKFAGIKTEFISRQTLSISTDAVALLDNSENKVVRLFDILTGRPLTLSVISANTPTTITHSLEISEIGLNQYHRSLDERKHVFIDRNRDMYITALQQQRTMKLSSMVDSFMWNDSSDMLLAIADSKLVLWYYPTIVFEDRDLLNIAREARDASEMGKSPQLVSFNGSRYIVRRNDGSLISGSVSPFPALLYEIVHKTHWDEAIRLCRFVKSDALWSHLAGMALHARHLDTVEIAYAALNEVDKLHFILHIKEIPSQEGRNSELALFRGQIAEAERILLQARPPLVYRAIKMNIRLFNWGRALDLAIQHKTHVDTVLVYRQQYLNRFQRQEQDARFLQYMEELGSQLNWEAIKVKRQQEKENEKRRVDASASS